MDKIKPRGKGIVGHTLGLRDSFKAFNKDQSPESLFFIDYKTYRSVCEKFNKKVVEDILYNAGEFKLPYRLGEIRIQKKKMKFDTSKMKINWKATKESGFRVYHMNDHRDNYRYRWYWKKKNVIVQNKTLYSFIPSRANKRELAKLLKTDKSIDYFE
tara:strand:- start:743 stop:1213 length:471 start_codon:yes stop_codon:yes gene_type:complete